MSEINQDTKQRRNKNILIIVIGIIMLCLLVCGGAYFGLRKAVSNLVQVDTEQGKNLANQITDYNLPVGYKEVGGSTVVGVITAAISDEKNDRNIIWLLQAPSDNLPAPENFLRDAISFQKNNPIIWTKEDISIKTIRGEKTPITIFNGVTEDQQKYHAWTGKFTGKGGPAIIVMVTTAETWNESVAENFLNSMR